MIQPLRQHIRRFRQEEDGVVTVEFLIMFPLLVWAYVAMFTFFDMMRVTAQHQKASYVIADMLSRETEFINATYIDNSKKLYDNMMHVDRDNAIRVSSIGYDEDNEHYEVIWSKTRGGQPELTTGTIRDWDDRLPILSGLDELILVETWYEYRIGWDIIDMDDMEMHSFVYTRPRFAPVLRYSDQTS